jgi:hypothetical protein
METEYLVEVEEVRSGDDLILLVNLGIDSLYKRIRARLYKVDTPDAYKAKPDTLAGQIREQVRQMTRSGQCRITIQQQNKTCWVVNLFVLKEDEKISINETLISMGFVYKGNQIERLEAA